MDGTRSTHGRVKNSFETWKPKAKIPFWRPMSWWEIILKWISRRKGWDVCTGEEFVTSWGNMNFRRKGSRKVTFSLLHALFEYGYSSTYSRHRYWMSWVASFRARSLFSRKNNPGTYWTGGWVVLRDCLDVVEKNKISWRCRKSKGVSPNSAP
jgi:hypothetical protein